MNKIDLKQTKVRLAIIFAGIIFCVSFFLEISFFSIRYYNISYFEKKEFNEITNQFNNQFSTNPILFDLFINEGIKFKPLRGMIGRGKPEDERGFRFLNFIILDNTGNIIAQNLNQNFDLKLDNLSINYNKIFNLGNNFLIKKVDISFLGGDYKDIIFIKKQNYSLNDYLKDVFSFFLITLLFSIFFYYIGIIFVGKNLKPVEKTLNDMNDFIHNANHELKTPISVISSNLQLIKATKIYEEDLINNSMTEIKRIDNLILELSNLSDINSISALQELDLEKEIKEIVEELKNEVTGKKIFLSIKVIKNILIKANKQYLYIIFSNLLRNAIKYTCKNGEININLDKNKLIISNTGKGITKEDLPYIFDRFFKGEKSRNTEGFGIGLSLVKKICDIYDWKIKVDSNENLTIFEIKF